MVGEWPRSTVHSKWWKNGFGPQYGGRMTSVHSMVGEWPRSTVHSKWWKNGFGPLYGGGKPQSIAW